MNRLLKFFSFGFVACLSFTQAISATELGLVTNTGSDNVSVFNLDDDTATTFDVGSYPYGIVVNPDSTTVYISNVASNSISVVDITTEGVYSVTTTIDLGDGAAPAGIAISSDGSLLAVACSGSSSVKFINTSTYAITTVATGAGSIMAGVTILSDGTYAYATDFSHGLVLVFDLNSFTIIDSIDIGSDVSGIDSNQASTRVYVAARNINTVVVIDTSTNTSVDSASVVHPYNLVVSPDDSMLYVVSYPDEGLVTAVNTSTLSVVDTAIVGGVTVDVAVNADGSLLLVSNNDTNKALLMNASNLSDYIELDTDSSPFGVAFANPIYETISPPTHLIGEQKAIKFLSQKEIVNTLRWSAPLEGVPPVSYAIYRDSELTDLVGRVSASASLIFKDHNRRKNTVYTYYVVSVDDEGNQSTPAFIAIPSSGR